MPEYTPDHQASSKNPSPKGRAISGVEMHVKSSSRISSGIPEPCASRLAHRCCFESIKVAQTKEDGLTQEVPSLKNRQKRRRTVKTEHKPNIHKTRKQHTLSIDLQQSLSPRCIFIHPIP